MVEGAVAGGVEGTHGIGAWKAGLFGLGIHVVECLLGRGLEGVAVGGCYAVILMCPRIASIVYKSRCQRPQILGATDYPFPIMPFIQHFVWGKETLRVYIPYW